MFRFVIYKYGFYAEMEGYINMAFMKSLKQLDSGKVEWNPWLEFAKSCSSDTRKNELAHVDTLKDGVSFMTG